MQLQDWTVNTKELEAWQEHTLKTFSLQMFSGDHFFLHSAEATFLLKLANKIQQVISRNPIHR